MTTSTDNAPALGLALELIDAAREQLGAYAAGTDEPLRGTVEAADLIDAAHRLLSEVSP